MIDAIDTLPDTTYTPDALSLHVRDMAQFTLLSAEEEAVLFARAQTDPAAREAFACCNLRLVLREARSYEGRGLPLIDCVSEGHLGLLRAMEDFDPARGRFSTYAIHWINQRIRRAVNVQARLIRVPDHQAQDITRLKRVVSDLSQDGDEPTDAAILDALLAQGKSSWTLARVQKLRRAALTPASLDAPMHNGYGAHDGGTLREVEPTLADILPDTETCEDAAEAAIARADSAALVARLLQRLTAREREVIALRYGLDGDMARSLEHVARAFGLSRERVRQIEVKALKKMRVGSEAAP